MRVILLNLIEVALFLLSFPTHKHTSNLNTDVVTNESTETKALHKFELVKAIMCKCESISSPEIPQDVATKKKNMTE